MSTSMKKKITRTPIVLDVYSPTRSEDHMLSWLSGRLIGQNNAVSAAVRIYTMALSKLKESEKAAGLYYLVGEPGVGKTELVKLLAEFIHGNRNAYVKIDGASLQEKNSANRLIGAPPGYVGYEDPKDTEAREVKEAEEAAKDPDTAARRFRKNPRKLLCRKNLVASRGESKVPVTILFVDEAEKMYHTVDDLFLNAVEDGVMSLGDNEQVEFGDVIVIYAGNPGSAEAVGRKDPIGFTRQTAEKREEQTREIIMNAIKARYRPEMCDRFDEFIYFNKLQTEDLRTITSLRINQLIERFMNTMSRGTAFTIEVQDSARDFMLEEALKNSGNARRISRAVRKYFTIPLNRLITLAEDSESELQVLSGDLIVVSHDKNYHEGALLKFELIEDGGVVAPQDTIKASAKDTPLAMKFAGLDRQLTVAAERAKKAPRNIYAVVTEHESELQMLEELQAAREESTSILRMALIEVKIGMNVPWTLTLYFQATEEQSNLLKQHYPLAKLSFDRKGKPAQESNEGPASPTKRIGK